MWSQVSLWSTGSLGSTGWLCMVGGVCIRLLSLRWCIVSALQYNHLGFSWSCVRLSFLVILHLRVKWLDAVLITSRIIGPSRIISRITGGVGGSQMWRCAVRGHWLGIVRFGTW